MLPNEPLFPVISTGTGSGSSNFLGVFATAPTTANDGDTYINSVDLGYYVFYGGMWHLIVTLSFADLLLLQTGDDLLLETGDDLALEA